MLHKERKKEPGTTILASVRKEMAKPRMTRSARIAELNLDTERISEQRSAAIPGTLDKIIPPPRSSHPGKAQVTLDCADQRHRNLRFENTLTDEHGDDVKLKKGSHVEVTVTEDPERKTTAISEEI